MCLRYSHKRVAQLARARRGLQVISHVLKVMPRDIIRQMSSIDQVWGKRLRLFTKVCQDTIDLLVKGTAHTRMKVIGAKTTVKTSATSDVGRLTKSLKGGRVMIAFFVNYSTVAFPYIYQR